MGDNYNNYILEHIEGQKLTLSQIVSIFRNLSSYIKYLYFSYKKERIVTFMTKFIIIIDSYL